jgi:uncharacterized damage-inducible protein DinB
VGLLPDIIERLRGTPARLEDRLGGLPRKVLTASNGRGWSIQEHAGHLLDLGSLERSRVAEYAAGQERLSPADLQNRKTNEGGHNERELADLLSQFRQERAEFVRLLEDADESLAGRSAMHPRLGVRMRLVDFAFFIAEHDDHHLAAITAILHDLKWSDHATTAQTRLEGDAASALMATKPTTAP